MLKRFFIIFRTILLSALCCIASGTMAQYECSVKHFNTNNGFPDNEVTTLAMDYDGYLWIGTYTCLVRYDGKNFKTFVFDTKKDSWSNIMLYAMNIPADKKLMIKTRTELVYSIQGGNPVLYGNLPIRNNNAWRMFYGYFPAEWQYKKFYRELANIIPDPALGGELDILPLNDKDFIAASHEFSQLVYIRNDSVQPIISVKVKLKKFLVLGSNRMMLDQQNALHLYDSASNQFEKVKIDWKAIRKEGEDIVNAVFFSDSYSGKSFAFYQSTFYLLDFNARQNLIRFIPQFSISDKKHFWTGLVYDSLHATFFLSTLNEGFFQVKLKKIHTYNVNERLPKNINPEHTINYSIVKTSDSTAVIPTGFQFTATDSGITTKKLGNIFGERETIGVLTDGKILTTTNSKLFYYSPDDGFRAPNVFNDSFNRYNLLQILMIHPEKDSLWISSRGSFWRISKHGVNIFYDFARGIGNDFPKLGSIRGFYRLAGNEALVYNDSGFYRMQTTPPYGKDAFPELKNMNIQSLIQFENAFIIAAYKSGLYVLKDGRISKVSMPEDLEGLSLCHSLYIDKDAYLWLTTDKGLFKSSASAVIESALKKGATTPFFFYYGNEDGIENTQFTGGGTPPYAILRGGHLLFPSLGGIVTFKANELSDKIIHTPVLIDKITIDNREIDKRTDSISLRPDFKYLVMDLNVPHFGNAQNLSVEYNLNNKEWKKILATDNMKITLVDIASGHHQLLIRKRTGFGNADYAYTRLAVYKEKSIYEKFWFYLLVLLALVLLVWVASKIQTRNINRKRKLLQKKVAEQTAELSKAGEVKDLLISIITHDMISPLRHVGLVAQVLEKGLEKDPQKAKNALAEIKSTTQKILSGSLSIVNWIKYNNKEIRPDKKPVNLFWLVNEAIEIFIPIVHNKNILLVNDVPKADFIEADYNIFTVILNNLVSNAIKHTQTGEVRIFVENTETASETVLKISDTGPGIDDRVLEAIKQVLKGNIQAVKTGNQSSTGLGYVMIAELARIHSLMVDVESEVNKGTTVSIIIPETGSQ